MADLAGKLERLSARGTPVDVEELIERIEAQLAGDPLIVVPRRRKGIVMTKTDQPVTSKGPGPGRGLGWAVAAFVAVLAVAGLFVLFRAREGQVVDQYTVPTPTTSPIPTTMPAPTTISGSFVYEVGTGDQTPLPEVFANAYMLVASPDGTRLFANTCCTPSDMAMIANLDGSDQLQWDPPGDTSYYMGRWSPDGTKIVYQATQGGTHEIGELFVEDLASGEQTQITDLELTLANGNFLFPAFSGDGERVYFHLPRRGDSAEYDVWSVPVTGGEPVLVLENASQWVPLPQEPSGAFVLPEENGFTGPTMEVITPDGRRTLVETNEHILAPSASPDGSRIVYTRGDEGWVYVTEVATGESVQLQAKGNMASWLDNDTLVVAPS
jgi:Tol biopolymer transport system component